MARPCHPHRDLNSSLNCEALPIISSQMRRRSKADYRKTYVMLASYTHATMRIQSEKWFVAIA